MLIQKKSPNSYGQEQLVTYEFIYEFIIFLNSYMNSMIFMNSYMNACMNSSTSEFRSIWIHETHEFMDFEFICFLNSSITFCELGV